MKLTSFIEYYSIYYLTQYGTTKRKLQTDMPAKSVNVTVLFG